MESVKWSLMMGKVLPINGRSRTGLGRARKLEHIKDELVRYHGIDLDELMASGPASGLSIDQFEELTENILHTIDDFCENHPQVTVHDVLYTLENVKDIIKDNPLDAEE